MGRQESICLWLNAPVTVNWGGVSTNRRVAAVPCRAPVAANTAKNRELQAVPCRTNNWKTCFRRIGVVSRTSDEEDAIITVAALRHKVQLVHWFWSWSIPSIFTQRQRKHTRYHQRPQQLKNTRALTVLS
ncbi:hypothetical protein J6590_071109 [Homalodisca vitripennis]|nr:hypothetical protein J6590_071109 [Homalodisca vitripennis]